MSFEIYEAIVVRNTDLELSTTLNGAVFFQCDQLLEDAEYPVPAQPLFPHEYFSVPDIGDLIEIEIDLSLSEPEPRWRCVVLNIDDELPNVFKNNYPKVKGIRTKSGSYLIFDDTLGSESITLFHKSGKKITFDNLGNLLEESVDHTLSASGDIKLGSSGASENLILGNVFSTLYNAHGHIGNLGSPTGIPIVPMGATELASKTFTQL